MLFLWQRVLCCTVFYTLNFLSSVQWIKDKYTIRDFNMEITYTFVLITQKVNDGSIKQLLSVPSHANNPVSPAALDTISSLKPNNYTILTTPYMELPSFLTCSAFGFFWSPWVALSK